MESSGVEKAKVKPEADYSFDPISASVDAWGVYLLNPKNFEKDFTQGEFPFKAPASTILEKVQEAGAPRSVIETAVQAALERWDEIAEPKFLRAVNPLEFIASLADDASVDVVQKLWTNAPKDSTLVQQGLRQVAEGLGVNIPLDQEGLEKLYTEQFDTYSFTALEIMLKRGEVARAASLFEERVDQYSKGNDPAMLDYLVGLGLPAASAKKWLDQSANSGAGYEPWYKEALERWGYKEDS